MQPLDIDTSQTNVVQSAKSGLLSSLHQSALVLLREDEAKQPAGFSRLQSLLKVFYEDFCLF